MKDRSKWGSKWGFNSVGDIVYHKHKFDLDNTMYGIIFCQTRYNDRVCTHRKRL